jgi:hypothetical protein
MPGALLELTERMFRCAGPFWSIYLANGGGCCAGTDHAYARRQHRLMRIPVLGGLTQAEGDALGAFATSGDFGNRPPDVQLGAHGVLMECGVLFVLFLSGASDAAHTLGGHPPCICRWSVPRALQSRLDRLQRYRRPAMKACHILKPLLGGACEMHRIFWLNSMGAILGGSGVWRHWHCCTNFSGSPSTLGWLSPPTSSPH